MEKKTRKTVVGAAASCLAALMCISGCQTDNYIRYNRIYPDLFGTAATLQLFGDFSSSSAQSEAKQFGDELALTLSALSDSLSASDKSSYVYAFNEANAGDAVEIDETLYALLGIALDMYDETGGYFNPGVWYSVDLYGFSVRADEEDAPYDRDYESELPDENYGEYITAFQELAGEFENIVLYQSNGKYYAVKPEKTVTVAGISYALKIDLGGISKGYAADIADKMIDDAGYEYALFNFGSSTMTINASYTSQDELWELTYVKPRPDDGSEEYYLSLRVRDAAVSTGGDYMQYYEIDGQRYCHIINPETGRPIETGITTATVVGGTAAENDARTTAICAMGVKSAVEYINEIKDKELKITFVYEDGAGGLHIVTNMAEDEYKLLDTDNYTLASYLDENGNVCLTDEFMKILSL